LGRGLLKAFGSLNNFLQFSVLWLKQQLRRTWKIKPKREALIQLIFSHLFSLAFLEIVQVFVFVSVSLVRWRKFENTTKQLNRI